MPQFMCYSVLNYHTNQPQAHPPPHLPNFGRHLRNFLNRLDPKYVYISWHRHYWFSNSSHLLSEWFDKHMYLSWSAFSARTLPPPQLTVALSGGASHRLKSVCNWFRSVNVYSRHGLNITWANIQFLTRLRRHPFEAQFIMAIQDLYSSFVEFINQSILHSY